MVSHVARLRRKEPLTLTLATTIGGFEQVLAGLGDKAAQ
jgi:hypothetical protein